MVVMLGKTMGEILNPAGNAVSRRTRLISISVTIGLIILIELLKKTPYSVPNPAVIVLLAVVYAAFAGGLRVGLACAALSFVYHAYYFSLPGLLFQYTPENLRRVIVLAITTPALPLIVGGRCLGVLCVFTRTDKKPEERRLKLLETVTAQIALAVQNAGLFEETLRNASVLDDRVKERTAELEKKIAEIERLNRLFVGRELRMKELKERIKELEKTFE